MIENVGQKDKKNCCSCYVCAQKCPQKCIVMQPDEKGFFYPMIDGEKCTRCGLCMRVCPLENVDKNSGTEKVCYSLISRDEKVRQASSSGGAFLSLCKSFFSQGDGVVFGVTLTEDFYARYGQAKSYQQCIAFCKSKYVKANAEDVYEQVRQKLQDGKRVLFVGTPCSVAALKKYLGKEYDTLFLIDFVCHGTPSHKEFHAYLRDKGLPLTKYEFRYRSGHINTNSLLTYANGKQQVATAGKDEYLRAFDQNLLQMESCFTCAWASTNRSSDITLGDFWGIEKHDTKYRNGTGVSLVIVHTDKGGDLIQHLSDAELTTYPLSVAVEGNPNLRKPSPKNVHTDDFIRIMNQKGFNKAVKKVLGRPPTPPLGVRIKHALKMFLINKLKINI